MTDSEHEHTRTMNESYKQAEFSIFVQSTNEICRGALLFLSPEPCSRGPVGLNEFSTGCPIIRRRYTTEAREMPTMLTFTLFADCKTLVEVNKFSSTFTCELVYTNGKQSPHNAGSNNRK